MLTVACLPSHPLEKLGDIKKQRGFLFVDSFASLSLFDSKGNRWFLTFSGFGNRNHLSLRLLHPSTFFSHFKIPVRSKKKSRITLHSKSGSFPPPSFLLPPSLRSSLPFYKILDWSAQQMYKVDHCLVDLLLPIRVGLTQKSSKKEWNHWRVGSSH
ncbi:hypothetical protein AMTRI_Chr02g214800 [Amborella trichopoda]